MTCQELDARVDEWLEGTLPPDEVERLEAHLATCERCHEATRKLRHLLAHAAALPRSLTPPRDLWPGIEREIARPAGWRSLVARGGLPLAAAAAVVLMLSAMLWWRGSPGLVRTVPMPPGAALEPAAARAGEDPGLAQAERDYDAAANVLLAALQQRKGALSPETLAHIERNLEVIDRALGEVRRALAQDPHSPELNRMLVSTHRKKVDVLRRVVRLSTAL